jgi:DNA repair protein RecN (Recombination protein N)
MLKHLTIKNYALIRHLELQPSAHLNVVTGETGAGKSIMLGAIGLLMGNRADTKVLWNEDDKCVIEGTFSIKNYGLKNVFKNEDLDYDDQTVFRREISPGGKSRAFINDTPVTLEVMRKIGGSLMDIHSQHETLQLGNQLFQLQLVDAYADNVLLREQYNDAWGIFLKRRKEYETLNSQAETLRQEADFTRFQLDELVKASLEPGEQENLESEMKVMEHAEEIKNRFNNMFNLLDNTDFSARNSLAELRSQLQPIISYSPAYESLFKRLESIRIELDDIAGEIEKEESKIEFDPERSEWIKERLSTIYRLLKKHRAANTNELLTLQENLQQKSDLTTNLDQELAAAKQTYDVAEQEVRKLALKLSETRKNAFDPLKKQLIKLLKELGLPDANLQMEQQVIEPASTGIDKIELLFSANKGISPRPLAQVASGGEFSRLMFCIKYVMAEKTAMPTLILDEIDNGISGEIAIKLGNMMKAMARGHQLITISHLPQIAAKGQAHYFVFKDNSEKKTVSNIRLLNEDERVEEIAKMIGGSKPSKVALENAQELLTQ